MAVRTRGKANESLHFARVILRAWDLARDSGRDSAGSVRGAFMPAVRLHLREAYGWFLLAVSGEETSVLEFPPACVDDLDSPPAGRMPPPELNEFALLEKEGWLGDMLRRDTAAPAKPASAKGAPQLLVSDQGPADYAVALNWAEQLESLMARVDDSLAEC
ncbi:MAG: hypothetical protein Cons2KO_16710 [Congregibacter sp.]